MRQALAGGRGSRFANQPAQASGTMTLPAPVEGLDSESPIAELPATRALVMDNWIPRGTSLEVRKGYTSHVTGIGANVEALLVYNSGSASQMFAAAGTAIYNVTSAGAVGAAVQTGLTSARWKGVNFTTSGGSFLWICNGADDPRHWNGTTWATPALTITTFTDNDIIYVCESKQRLFFAFKNSLTFGYLPVDSVAGTVSNFSLGSVFGRGGRLVAIGTMTRDGGAGPEDYTCFLTSQGEVAIYSGTNPASAADWALVGRWYVGEPKGDDPLVELDGDLGVITSNGLVLISQAFNGGAATSPPRYLTAQISTLFRDAIANGAANGWQGLFYPAGDMLIINTPVSSTVSRQFVRHTATGGWTRFTGMNASSWAVFGGALYFGDLTGTVWKADNGYADNGGDVTALLQTGWNSFGDRGRQKRLTMARPIITTETAAAVSMVARMDYNSTPPLPGVVSGALTGALIWGTGSWGTGLWGGASTATRQWRSLSGVGSTVSILLQAEANESRLALNGIDLIYETGGLI